MIILACDGCGLQSPDANGQRVADNWITITAQTQTQRRAGLRPRQTVLCETCWLGLGWERGSAYKVGDLTNTRDQNGEPHD